MDYNVYTTPTEQIVTPAVVIRPDEPWIEPGPGYSYDLERYVAVIVASSADPESAVQQLYDVARDVIANLDYENGWDWVSLGTVVRDSSTGSTFLVAPLRLTYRHT